ncbi:MAG: ATP-binding cassette domain-containing protein [Cyanobacteria bacterium]|nr:ATP-binding cassette domain-containing protein [Cyanobacteriota bacterium]
MATLPSADASLKTLIRVENITKSFNGIPILKGITFDVKEHEVVAIIGASGCGKSTLLRMISGLETYDSGEIHLEDPNFTMVFQYSALFDSLNVFENVGFSLIEPPDRAIGDKETPFSPHLSQAEIADIVHEKLRLVGLEGIEKKYPNELSGGMQKRVSFARAIVSNPRIILYDEPTAGLDPIASTVIEDYILKLRNELQAASVVVTHQFSTIYRTADRVLLLDEGSICWTGTPEELKETNNPIARHFAHAGDKPENV